MSGYFSPLRRKIGLITLGLACVLMGLRIRSGLAFDALYLRNIAIGSIYHQIVLCRFDRTLQTTARPSNWFLSGPLKGVWPGDPQNEPYLEFEIESEIACWGYRSVHLKPRDSTKDSMRVVSFSYWIVITPLTLLSAWLLLSKRVKKIKPIELATKTEP